MPKETVSFRIEPMIKRKLEYIAKVTGFSMADNFKIAINTFIDDFEKKHGIIQIESATLDERPKERGIKNDSIR